MQHHTSGREQTGAPEGFRPLFGTSPLVDLLGPFYCRGEGANLVIGLRVEEKHCNAGGTVHGGVLATLADVSLGYVMGTSSDPPVRVVTVNLSLNIAGTARVGDWLQSHVDIHKHGNRLLFANCYLSVGEQRIVHASAVLRAAGQLKL